MTTKTTADVEAVWATVVAAVNEVHIDGTREDLAAVKFLQRYSSMITESPSEDDIEYLELAACEFTDAKISRLSSGDLTEYELGNNTNAHFLFFAINLGLTWRQSVEAGKALKATVGSLTDYDFSN